MKQLQQEVQQLKHAKPAAKKVDAIEADLKKMEPKKQIHILWLLQQAHTNYEEQGKMYLENAIFAILNLQKNETIRETLFDMQAKINKMSLPELKEITKTGHIENFKSISNKI